jgi:hypothetical protein
MRIAQESHSHQIVIVSGGSIFPLSEDKILKASKNHEILGKPFTVSSLDIIFSA